MARYNFSEIEKKWQNYWESNQTFKVTEDENIAKDKRKYILDMFPYPSAAGLHVGHPEGYTATDIYCRYLRANGYHVLHPMGFDSFGLPAENYAIKTGTHPLVTTEANIKRFREQIKALGFSYDWSRELSTHEPSYYKWTQWLFLQLYKQGLAYESEAPINWCPSCLTGLANEEVLNDGACERCGTKVTRKQLRQWLLKITAYGDKLLAGLDELDWPPSLKTMQQNWIGRSEGACINFTVEGSNDVIKVYTTRPDTLYGATYVVLAPEHKLVSKIVTINQKDEVNKYIEAVALKSELERTDLSKHKTGVFSGAYAINPINKERVPIWLGDYVLASYGTGAIMAVPGHDERDNEFAKQYNLPIIEVVNGGQPGECFTGEGVAMNSDFINGKSTTEAKKLIIDYLQEHNLGEKTVQYKLRDWLFSRQRYWGEPIPIVHCTECGIVPLPESELPLTLPNVSSYTPSGTGESPLAAITEWVNTICPACGGPAKRETNTMPQWAGSCWYYLRYTDPLNDKAFCDGAKEKYWLPVNLYVGGVEHAVLHLLYARFWHKVFYDMGLVSSPEPFIKLINQGMILGEDNQKMSKSRGNVINPDDIITQFGADSLRLYEMFMGPLTATKPWATAVVSGISRFLGRVYDVASKPAGNAEPPIALTRLLHKTIKKVTADTANFEFNTAISAMMIFINEATKEEYCYTKLWPNFVKLLAPYAPHLSEELWQRLGHNDTISYEVWPTYDEALTIDNEVTIGVQINGKLRAELTVAKDITSEKLSELALANEKVAELAAGKVVKKVIAIPGKIVNIVIG
ncbi:MAG: leucine--tRNA ligase [Spirochaetaceae bacterium]|nr:leucine--tRNA ligase [Spirochaetaceae bacterium]